MLVGARPPEAGMEQRETPYPDPETPFLEVEVLPGPQELHSEAEDVPESRLRREGA